MIERKRERETEDEVNENVKVDLKKRRKGAEIFQEHLETSFFSKASSSLFTK